MIPLKYGTLFVLVRWKGSSLEDDPPSCLEVQTTALQSLGCAWSRDGGWLAVAVGAQGTSLYNLTRVDREF